MIKLIALDLDGTTLNSKSMLAQETKAVLEAAILQGVGVVIATGRVFSALPEDVLEIKGIQYVLTSNGAIITDLLNDKTIYENHLDPTAVETAVDLLRERPFMVEAFTGGEAYIEKRIYDEIKRTGIAWRNGDYILKTRKPIDGIYDFILEHSNKIENLCINFESQDDKREMGDIFRKIDNVTLTTSFNHNWELGGITASKGNALKALCDKLNLHTDQIMACGDSPNDKAMLAVAGIPIAVGNAKQEVKEAARYIVGTNDENGVAQAVKRFVLK